ncbi:retrovirus-related pol polyprotein from transposon TNT 1-94 [Tanacetum coccineum]
MFDEYFIPPSSAVSPVQVAATLRAVDIASSPSSTTIDLYAPSTSSSSTNQQQQSSIISQGVKELLPNAHFDYLCHEPLHDVSTLQESSSNVQSSHSPLELISKWTKDHLLANMIEPKNFKESMLESSWIDAMQEEIHEFGRLQNRGHPYLHRKCCQQEYDDLLDGRQNTFLNGELKEEVYVSQQEGFVDQDNPSHVDKLKKAIYGLKQALHAWYDMLSIYVDDIIFASTNTSMCDEFANLMTTKFKMSMIGQMSFFLGLQISQSPRGIFINQSKYASEIIKKCGMRTSDSVDTPMVEKNNLNTDLQGTPVDATYYRGMIGSIMYLTSSRPNLIYVVCLCARYQAKPTKKHLHAVINLLAGHPRSKRALRSRVQRLNILPYLDVYDNKSAIALFCKNVQHSKAKHIDVRYHFIKEQVENGIVELYFVQTKYQLADIFTKPWPREIFNFLIEKLGIKSMSLNTLKSLAEEEDE